MNVVRCRVFSLLNSNLTSAIYCRRVGVGCYATVANSTTPSLWGRFKWSMGLTGKLRIPKRILSVSGLRMYLCCVELVDYKQMFEVLELPDTFNSWFLVTELHVWLSMVKLAQMEKEGQLLRNSLVKSMWGDVDKRSKQLGESASMTVRKEGIQELGNIFYGSLFAYDEGLLGGDHILAGALWRILFEMKDKDPQQLALMVEYVRKQAKFLESQDEGVIMTKGLITFLPLYGDKQSEDLKKKLVMIYNVAV